MVWAFHLAHRLARVAGCFKKFGGRLVTDISNIINSTLMPIDNGTTGTFNSADYRWMNIDIPDDPGSTGDVELFYPLKSDQLGLGSRLSQALTCETEPLSMEARVVGSIWVQRTDVPILPGTIPDVLEKFDQTGLICRNASQAQHEAEWLGCSRCAEFVFKKVPGRVEARRAYYSGWMARRCQCVARPVRLVLQRFVGRLQPSNAARVSLLRTIVLGLAFSALCKPPAGKPA